MLARPACQHASATANAKSSCSLEDGSTHPHNSRTSAPASLNPFAIFNCPFSSNTCISLNKSALGTVQHSPGPQMFDCCRTLATGNRLRRNPSPRPHLRRPQFASPLAAPHPSRRPSNNTAPATLAPPLLYPASPAERAPDTGPDKSAPLRPLDQRERRKLLQFPQIHAHIEQHCGWVRLHEKGGKVTELPCHRNLETALDEWLRRQAWLPSRPLRSSRLFPMES